MASNSFGNIFKITTWGESHGKAIGVVIDGCPAGLSISDEEICQALKRRSPGQSPLTSPRKEQDGAEILSGVFNGVTTGAPISIIIYNRDVDSSKYEATKQILKPGHAQFGYLEKYGIFDDRGGGRASARETACRVAAGAVAKKFLDQLGIKVEASLKKVGDATNPEDIAALILTLKEQGDSIGGMVEFIADIPSGLGDPVYEKLEANLSHAMMTLPASKGFEIGSGMECQSMKGSEHNDLFIDYGTTATNHAGGTLGGISTGMPLVGRVAFKPASSIQKEQESVTLANEKTTFKLPEGSRHDPCVAIRAVPVVEAMVYLVLADAILLNRCAKV